MQSHLGRVEHKELNTNGQTRLQIDKFWFTGNETTDDVKEGDIVAIEWLWSGDNKTRLIQKVCNVQKPEAQKMDRREQLIVRQTCIKAASDFASNKTILRVEDIIHIAGVFEQWILR